MALPVVHVLATLAAGAAGTPSPGASATPHPSPSPSLTVPLAPPLPTVEAPAPAPSSGGGCGWFDVGCKVSHAITSWFADLVTSAVNPLFAVLGKSLLSTPQVGDFSTVQSLQAGTLAIADAGYVLLVLTGGILFMSNSVRGSYAVKDIAPRLVIGIAAAHLSLLLAGKAIMFANGLSAGVAGQGLDPATASAMLRSLVLHTISSGGMFFVLLALFAVLLVLILAGVYVARLVLTVLLIAVAPLALACHGLPQTEQIARWWWRAFAGILLIQSAQAIVLVAALRIFFTEQWSALINVPTGGLPAFDTIQLLALLYILARIPFWIGRRVWVMSGRSPIRAAARYAFGALVLRRFAPILAGGRTNPPAVRSRTTRTVTTSPSGASTVKVRTVRAQQSRYRQHGTTHTQAASTRTTTVQRFPAPAKTGKPRPPSKPQTTTVTTTTHATAGNRSQPYAAPQTPQPPRPQTPPPASSPGSRPGPPTPAPPNNGPRGSSSTPQRRTGGQPPTGQRRTGNQPSRQQRKPRGGKQP